MFERLVRYHAGVHPGAPAVITPARVVSYRILHDDMQRFAARLRKIAAPGSRCE